MYHVHTDSLGLSVSTTAQVLEEDSQVTDSLSVTCDSVISAHDMGSDLMGRHVHVSLMQDKIRHGEP